MGIATEEGSTVEINGAEVPVTFDGDNVIVNGEAVPVSETVGGDAAAAVVEGGSVDVNGEEVPVIFDGENVIVNGEAVPEAVPADSVVNGESYSQAVLSLSDNLDNDLHDLVAASFVWREIYAGLIAV